MKRVLMVSNYGFEKGGVQSVMMSIVRNLHHEYCFDAVVRSAGEDYFKDEFISFGGKIVIIDYYSGKNRIIRWLSVYFETFMKYKKIKKILKENGPYDIIHCHNRLDAAMWMKAAAKLGIPIRVSHAHVILQSSGVVSSIANKTSKAIIAKYATHQVGCSAKACKSFFKPDTDYNVIVNSYDDEQYCIESSTVANQDNLILVQVGRFEDDKNQKFSLQVMKHLVSLYPQSELRFVGKCSGQYYNQMMEYITKENLTKHIVFFGSHENQNTVYQNAFCSLLTSKREGFGIVAIESQAMGVRCYASNAITKEVDAGGVIYMNDNSSEAWAKTILEDYTKNGVVRMNYNCAPFSPMQVAKEYEKIYGG